MLKDFLSSLASIGNFLCVSPAFVHASTLFVYHICTSIFTVQKMSAHSNLYSTVCSIIIKLDREPVRYSWKTSRERKTSAVVVTFYGMVLYCACAVVARVCFRCAVSSRGVPGPFQGHVQFVFEAFGLLKGRRLF